MSAEPTARERGLLKATARTMREQLEKRDAQIAALEKRLAALEARKGFAYRGVWSEDETYEPDDFVTHQGSLWHTDCETRERPGVPGSPWQLAVKRGRDAR